VFVHYDAAFECVLVGVVKKACPIKKQNAFALLSVFDREIVSTFQMRLDRLGVAPLLLFARHAAKLGYFFDGFIHTKPCIC